LLPVAGEAIVPRNYGHATGSFTANLRISRTFGFGDVHKASASNQKAGSSTASAGGDKRGSGGPGARGPMIAGGGGVEMKGGGGGGGPQMIGMGGGGGPASSEKKYNLTVSVFIQNILNNVNYAAPDGNLSSPLFGQPRSLAGGGFGGFGGGGFSGGSPNAGNRRVSINMRLNF